MRASTRGVLARGVLIHEFGVDQTDIEWWWSVPRNIPVAAPPDSSYPPAPTTSNGPAPIYPIIPISRPCFPALSKRASAYYQKTGMFPINHAMIILIRRFFSNGQTLDSAITPPIYLYLLYPRLNFGFHAVTIVCIVRAIDNNGGLRVHANGRCARLNL